MSAPAERVPFVSLDVLAVPTSVPQVRRAVVAFAADHGADEAVAARVALAVTEAVTNVVLHAYAPGDETGLVHVVADVADDAIEVVVADDGEGFRPGGSPGLGAGLGIVAESGDDFAIAQRPHGGVEVWMRFFVPGSA
jgi:serine/threonine-protein kinase RsbW